MLTRGFHHELPRHVILKWMLLSVLSGSVNAGGFLAVQRFVTHVTGFATLFGVDLASGRVSEAFGILSVPVFFLLGAMISSYFIDRRYRQKKNPRYALVMGLVSGCLFFAAALGSLQVFGVFGQFVSLRQDYLLMALLCLASGLQNAAITSASGGVVRTSHLTGPTTDLGIGISLVLFPSGDEGVDAPERKKLVLKAGAIFSFVVGSAIGAWLFLRFKYFGFLFPSALALYTMFQTLGVQQFRLSTRMSKIK